MGSEYDGGLQIWRKRLGIWRKADGRRMEAHNILTPCPSLLTLGLFGIFGTKLICFTFCEPLHLARAEQKVLSILTWERYRWFDGISGRFDCVGYISRISRVAIPMIPAHMWTRLLSIDNGTNPSLCITFEHFGAALYIEYWTESCGHVPLLETHPCPHVDIWIKQGSNVTNVGHYLRSDQYQHLHKSTQRKTGKYLLDSYFGWVWLGRGLVHLSGFPVTSSYLSTSTAGKDWIHQNMFHGNHENTEKAARRNPEQRLFCGTVEWSWVN